MEVVVIGAWARDTVGQASAPNIYNTIGNTNLNGTIMHQWGGVARNIVEALARLHVRVLFVTASPSMGTSGAEDFNVMSRDLQTIGAEVYTLYPKTTAGAPEDVSVLDSEGELVASVSDFGLFESVSFGHFSPILNIIAKSRCVIVENNLSVHTLWHLANYCSNNSVPCFCECVSLEKASRCIPSLDNLIFIKPNISEISTILQCMTNVETPKITHETAYDTAKQILSLSRIPLIILTMGARGALLVARSNNLLHATLDDMKLLLTKRKTSYDKKVKLPNDPTCDVCNDNRTISNSDNVIDNLNLNNNNDIDSLKNQDSDFLHVEVQHNKYNLAINTSFRKNTSGAGDSLVAATVWALIKGAKLDLAIECGMKASQLSLLSQNNICPNLCDELFESLIVKK